MRLCTVRQHLCLVVALLSWTWPPALWADQAHHRAHTAHEEIPAGTLSTASLYQVSSIWTTATEQPFHLGELRGKPQVVAMFYTSCEYACPLLVNIMQQIEAALPPEEQARVGFVLITFDPVHDTPAVLRSYRDKLQLDPQRWVLLHGQAEDVGELAMLLGVKFKREPQGGFAHTNAVTVLNTEGEIVHRHEGLQAPLGATLAAIKQTLVR